MGRGVNLQIDTNVGTGQQPIADSAQATSNSSPANTAGQLAKQANLPDEAITAQGKQVLQLLAVGLPNILGFPALVNLCQTLAKAQIRPINSNDRLQANDPDNALSQLFLAKKPTELPNATGLLHQMRKVLTWEALRDPNNETAQQNKNAVQQVIGHLNEKMGCASKNLPVSALLKKIVNGLLSTLRKPFQDNAHANNEANAALSAKHAPLELFCDLMTKQGTLTPSETVSLLFHACPPENLEKLKNAFRQAAAHYPENKEKQDMFKNMADCLKLAIQTGKFINKIKHQDLTGIKYERVQETLVLTEEQKNNPDILMAIVQKSGHGLKYASDDLKNNLTIVMAAVKQNGCALQFASETFKGDREVVMAALEQNGWSLKFASDALRNNKEIVVAAVKKSGKALEFASETFKGDRGVVVAAIEQNGWALQFASDALRNDRNTVMAAVKQSGLALEFASDALKNDPEIVMAAVEQHGMALQYAPDLFKNNHNVVLAAVSHRGDALRYASDELKNNPVIVLAAVKQYGGALSFASDALKSTYSIVLAAVQQHGESLQYASAALKKNLEIVLAALRQNGDALGYVAPELHWHPAVLKVLYAKRLGCIATPATQP